MSLDVPIKAALVSLVSAFKASLLHHHHHPQVHKALASACRATSFASQSTTDASMVPTLPALCPRAADATNVFAIVEIATFDNCVSRFEFNWTRSQLMVSHLHDSIIRSESKHPDLLERRGSIARRKGIRSIMARKIVRK